VVRARISIVFILPRRGDGVTAHQPALKIDVGAPAGTEGAIIRRLRLAAEWTLWRAHRRAIS
jgi:hypothetical protein